MINPLCNSNNLGKKHVKRKTKKRSNKQQEEKTEEKRSTVKALRSRNRRRKRTNSAESLWENATSSVTNEKEGITKIRAVLEAVRADSNVNRIFIALM